MTSCVNHHGSLLLKKKQLKELQQKPVDGFSAGLRNDDNIYEWEVMTIGPPNTFYEGGYFKAHLTFAEEYPMRPPKMRFVTDM